LNWSNTWNDNVETKPAPPTTADEQDVVKECQDRYGLGEDWEAEARVRFDFDYKFANGDTHNKYQWDSDLVQNRELEDRPVLTINKTNQHNLLVINDAKQNKPGVRIRPVSDEATFEAAQLYQELIYHTEYISSAENVYDNALVFQVEAGIGYWRIKTEFLPKSFDQEIYIRRIKDPRSVYLDPDINEVDGSDARWGIIFEDMPKDLFQSKYPQYAGVASQNVIGNGSVGANWVTRNTIRVAEYYRKNQIEKTLVTFVIPDTQEQILDYVEDLDATKKIIYREIKKLNEADQAYYKFRERKELSDEIEWFLIAGDRIVDKKPWVGKYIPIVRLVGVETVIDGILDRKGHTRALINAQQIYNYNTSANVEYGALQTKAPWLAPAKAIEGYEEYYKTANRTNHSYLPYQHMDEDGNPIPPPSRPAAPQSSPAYVEQMQIAQNEMMMASGQYQSQFGENENAKSGVAINARQRQGDRSTYHFLDNQAIAIRYTGRILLDLYPKIYDTKRIKQITARDGTKKNIIIDPNAQDQSGNPVSSQKLDTLNQDKDRSEQIEQILFNPLVGMYDVQSDTGPSYATKRMEAFNALTQIAAQNPKFMDVGGDLYFKVADFPEADILAERWRRMIPPNITGDTPDPQTEQIMHQASDKIEQLTGLLAEATKKLADKDKELTIKAQDLDLRFKTATAEQARLDYDAETKRLVGLGNSGPAITPEQIQPIVKQLIVGMLNAGEPGKGDEFAAQLDNMPAPVVEPPIEGAKQAPDGKWYVPDPNRQGKYLRVEGNPNQQTAQAGA
jgi:hypothetical protein